MLSHSQSGNVAPSSDLSFAIIRGGETVQSGPTVPLIESATPAKELSLAEIVQHGMPQKGLPDYVNRWRRSNLRHLWAGASRVLASRTLGLPTFYGTLSVVLQRDGRAVDLGIASMELFTTAGVNYIVDAWQNIVEMETMKYHGMGTGTNAAAIGDTALQTELTTQYNPDNTRATGSLTEGASANIFRTVGTNTVDASVAITEWGLFSQAAVGGGTLMDRAVFSALNLISGDSLSTTFDGTLTAGS